MILMQKKTSVACTAILATAKFSSSSNLGSALFATSGTKGKTCREPKDGYGSKNTQTGTLENGNKERHLRNPSC